MSHPSPSPPLGLAQPRGVFVSIHTLRRPRTRVHLCPLASTCFHEYSPHMMCESPRCSLSHNPRSQRNSLNSLSLNSLSFNSLSPNATLSTYSLKLTHLPSFAPSLPHLPSFSTVHLPLLFTFNHAPVLLLITFHHSTILLLITVHHPTYARTGPCRRSASPRPTPRLGARRRVCLARPF